MFTGKALTGVINQVCHIFSKIQTPFGGVTKADAPFTVLLFLLMNLILVNSVPSDKILDCSKLKAFEDDIINLNKTSNFLGEG